MGSQSVLGCDPGHPYLFWLGCVSSQASLNSQLAVVPGHLRGQGPQLIWAGHRFGHLKHTVWLSKHDQSMETSSPPHTIVHFTRMYVTTRRHQTTAVTHKPQAAGIWIYMTTLKVVPPNTIIYSLTAQTICS